MSSRSLRGKMTDVATVEVVIYSSKKLEKTEDDIRRGGGEVGVVCMHRH